MTNPAGSKGGPDGEAGIAHLRARVVVAFALALGLLTGLGEASLLGIKQQLLGQFVRFGPDLVWMAPVSDALVFLAVSLMVIGAARLWQPLGRAHVQVSVLAFLGFLSVLLLYYPLHPYARVLLAAGLAVSSARLAARWMHRVDGRFGLRCLIAVAVVVALVAAVARIGPWFVYRRHVAALSQPASAPNVLLVVWDTVRARNLSLYGYERPTTPNLERWARSAAVFERAMSTSPWTLPSHASMFTGEWPQDLSAGFEMALDGKQLTLAEALTGAGYTTAGFVANTFYCGYELGLARGFARYDDYPVSPRELFVSSTLVRTVANSPSVRDVVGYHDNIPRRDAADVTDSFIKWQSTVRGRPFFAFLNYFDAHEPYLPPAPFDQAFGPGPVDSPAFLHELRRSFRLDWSRRSESDIQGEINRYDGAIAYLDSELNRLLSALQARGALEDTIVIVTSDHGEQFGEHGLFVHGNSLYQPLLHVPLIVRFPPLVPAGRRIVSRVTLRDLPATVMDLVGRADKGSFPGRSLARHWSAAPGSGLRGSDVALAEVRDAAWAEQLFPSYPAAAGDMVSATDDGYHYIRNGDGTEELYEIADAEEKRDLSGRMDSRHVLERFRAIVRTAPTGGGQVAAGATKVSPSLPGPVHQARDSP
jgi:arylsulfatase A-like enzyme